MNNDNTGDDAEKVKLLFEKIKKEKGDLYAETIAPLKGASWKAVHFQYYLKLGISFFFVAVFAFMVYYMVSKEDYDPELFLALGMVAFIAFGVWKEAKRTTRYTESHSVKGIVTDKIEKYQNNIPLQYAVISEKRKIRIIEDDYRNLALGDIVLVNFVDSDDPSLPVSVRKLGSILQEESSGETPYKPAIQSHSTNRFTLRYYFGRFVLALFMINVIFLLAYGARTVATNQYVEKYTVFYWVLAIVSLTPVCYFIVYPLMLERIPKVLTRIGAVVYFCVGAMVSTAPLLIAMDHLLVTIRRVETPEAFGSDEQRYFMFDHYHLHRELQYDSVYYRYDRGARGQSPRDEFNYFAIIPLSATREDTVFSLFLYRSVSIDQATGSPDEIEDDLYQLYEDEHPKTMAFPFDSITYFNRSEGGTLTKSTLGQLVGDRVAEMPFQSTAEAILLEPRTDNPRDEGLSFLLFYVIAFGVFTLFSIAFS